MLELQAAVMRELEHGVEPLTGGAPAPAEPR